MEFAFEIRIGEVIDLSTNRKEPRTTVCITKEQFDLIEILADSYKDEDLTTVYKINKLEFTVVPKFNVK